jgi:Tol biopolymer transport system component
MADARLDQQLREGRMSAKRAIALMIIVTVVALVALAVLAAWASGPESRRAAAVQADGLRKPFDSAPGWSPDGELIAFTRGADATLRVINVRTGRMTLLSGGVHNGGDARWSPNGRWLAYVRGSDRTLRVANTRTRRSIQLLDGVIGLAVGAWSPDQRSLAVTSKRDNTHSARCFGIGNSCTELYVVAASGGTPRRLTHNLTDESALVWSPDGQRIAFLSGHGDPRRWRDVTLDGIQRRVLAPPRQANPLAVRSRLNGTLAYTLARDGNGRTCWESSGGIGCRPNGELYLRLPSGRRVRVTHSRVDESDLVWSPDGRTLAFQSGGRLMLVNNDGGKLRALIAK